MKCTHGFNTGDCGICHDHTMRCNWGGCNRKATKLLVNGFESRKMCDRHAAQCVRLGEGVLLVLSETQTPAMHSQAILRYTLMSNGMTEYTPATGIGFRIDVDHKVANLTTFQVQFIDYSPANAEHNIKHIAKICAVKGWTGIVNITTKSVLVTI